MKNFGRLCCLKQKEAILTAGGFLFPAKQGTSIPRELLLASVANYYARICTSTLGKIRFELMAGMEGTDHCNNWKTEEG